MNFNDLPAIILGVIIGAGGLSALLANSDNIITQAKSAIAECEKDLPRSQHCELTAKIKENKND